jgi:hypothetical protein
MRGYQRGPEIANYCLMIYYDRISFVTAGSDDMMITLQIRSKMSPQVNGIIAVNRKMNTCDVLYIQQQRTGIKSIMYTI